MYFKSICDLDGLKFLSRIHGVSCLASYSSTVTFHCHTVPNKRVCSTTNIRRHVLRSELRTVSL